MAKNVKIAGASYNDVPSILLPLVSGGFAKFIDEDEAGEGGGGGLPEGIAAFDYGDVVISTAFTTSRKTFGHKLGAVPDLMIVYSPQNVAQTYSMLCSIRGSVFGWRSSAYDGHNCYHGTSTTTATWVNSNSTTYGISNMTDTSFDLASTSSSYYWRAGTYKYIAIKFA